MQKVFIDTNIIVDFLDKTRENHHKATLLFEKLLQDTQIIISEDMLSTIFYIINKTDKQATQNLIAFFQEINRNKAFFIAHFGTDTIQKACEYYLANGGDFEDYLQYFCAKSHNCFAIYSNDKEFQTLKLGIPIKSYDV